MSSGQDFTYLSNIVLQEKLVQGVRDLHPADEGECGDVLTAIRDLDQLALKVVNVRFETVSASS